MANGASGGGEGSSGGDRLGPSKRIDRGEYVRLLQQALHRLGYAEVALKLEQQSGIEMQPSFATSFQAAVRSGDWPAAVALLPQVMAGPSARAEGEFLILRQKYHELLGAGDQTGALRCLRAELAPLNVNQAELHKLAVMLLCGQPERPAGMVPEEHIAAQRSQVLEELQGLLLPSLIIPDGRLEHLVEQALLMQVANCPYHNGTPAHLSLFADYSAGPEQLPTQTVQVLDAHTDEVWHLQFSHDGKMLASASKDTTSIIWAITSSGECSCLHTLKGVDTQLTYVSWSHDDSMLLTCGNSGDCGLWSVGSGQLLKRLKKHTSTVVAAAWFPAGDRFVTGGYDKRTVIWNTDGEVLRVIQDIRINDLVVTGDGEHLVCVVSEKHLRIHRLADDVSMQINRDEPMTSLALCPDGSQLLVNLASHTINLWSMANLKRQLGKAGGGGAAGGSRIPGPPPPGPHSQGDVLVEYKRGRPEKQGRFVIRSAFGGSHSNFVVSGSEDSQVYIWHKDTGDLLEVMPGHSGTVNAVSWNPVFPHILASGSDDRSIRVWMSPVMTEAMQP